MDDQGTPEPVLKPRALQISVDSAALTGYIIPAVRLQEPRHSIKALKVRYHQHNVKLR